MIGDQRGKSTRVPLADGAHLPCTLRRYTSSAMTMDSVVRPSITYSYNTFPGRIGDPSGRCSSAPEVRRSVVERDDGANLLDIGGYAGE